MRRATEPQYIYMLVTEDKYELPVMVASSASQLAKMCGVTANTVLAMAWRHDKGIHKRSKYVRVKLEEGDDDELTV